MFSYHSLMKDVRNNGEVTEWLRGTPGKRVRLKGPAGSNPALSAN